MVHPFFNEKELSDDQIIEKLNRLHAQLSHAERYGQQQMANSIRMVIMSLQDEQVERYRKAEEEKLVKEKIDTTAPITFGEIEELDKYND